MDFLSIFLFTNYSLIALFFFEQEIKFNKSLFFINKKMKNHVNLLINHLVNFIYTTFFPGVVLFFALFPQQGIFLS